MKILIDAHGLEGQKAGKAFYSCNLLQGLSQLPQAKRHSFFLFSPTKVDLGFKIPSNFKWLTGSPKGPGFHLNLLQEIYRQKHDLFWSPTSFIPLALGKEKMLGTVYDFATFQKNHFLKNQKAALIEKLFIKQAIKRASALIAISQNTYSELLERFPEAKNKSFVIPGSPKKYPAKPSKKTLAKYRLSNQNYLLFVGTLEPRKNLINTLLAYRSWIDQLLLKKQPVPKFALVGKKGWHAENIFRTINDLKLKNHVRWLGYVPDIDLPALYRWCQFFVYVPFYEGFGLPVIEAIAFKKACLTSNLSSLPEVVGPCGLKVNPYDVSEISQAFNQLWQNTKLRKKYEQKASKWIQNFSGQKNAQKMLEVLKFALKMKA